MIYEDHSGSGRQSLVYFPQVASIPMAAANITPVATHPSMFVPTPFTLSPMTFLLFETSMMITSNGGETSPLMTAVQNSADIGFIPAKFISMPTSVEAAITDLRTHEGIAHQIAQRLGTIAVALIGNQPIKAT